MADTEEKLRLWLTAHGYAERTRDEIYRTVQTFLGYCEERQINPSHIRIAEAETYREYCSVERHCAVSTVNKELSYLCIYYDYRVQYHLSFSNPFRAVEKMKEAYRLPKGILTIDELAVLFDAIDLTTTDDLFFYTCIELLYATGLRISELESLRYSNMHLDDGYITVTDTKAKRERIVPLPEYTISVLTLYLSTSPESLFQRGKKRSLNRHLNNKLQKLCTKAKLPAITCHSLRHTLATHLLKSGADIRQVQEYLGHRRVKTTEVYTRIFPEELLSVIQENHPREQYKQEVCNESDKRNSDGTL